MFNKKSSEQEILESMENSLISDFLEKESKPFSKLDSAISHINIAAELFDDVGLTAEAEEMTELLEKIAKKKKKTKKSKKKDSASKGLTSEKMVENLKEKGWVFNADDDLNDARSKSKKSKEDLDSEFEDHQEKKMVKYFDFEDELDEELDEDLKL